MSCRFFSGFCDDVFFTVGCFNLFGLCIDRFVNIKLLKISAVLFRFPQKKLSVFIKPAV